MDAAVSHRVLVLRGGRSSEREVSLNSGAQVAEALESLGHRVTVVDAADEDFIQRMRDSKPEVVFVCLHGRFGEDGAVQGLLEILGIPYVGSGVLASALAMDKAMSKHVYSQAGLLTPDYVVLHAGESWSPDDVSETLGPKTVVKPANEGSAIGVTVAHSPAELPRAVEEAFGHDRDVLVEAFVSGVETTVGVIGNDGLVALPVIEIVPENEFYDYESKYVPGMSRHVIPARLDGDVLAECQEIAMAAHRALGCRGLSRSDAIVTAEGSIYLLETNTIPGMTSTSLLPDAARAAGIDFPELCDRLVRLALE